MLSENWTLLIVKGPQRNCFLDTFKVIKVCYEFYCPYLYFFVRQEHTHIYGERETDLLPASSLPKCLPLLGLCQATAISQELSQGPPTTHALDTFTMCISRQLDSEFEPALKLRQSNMKWAFQAASMLHTCFWYTFQTKNGYFCSKSTHVLQNSSASYTDPVKIRDSCTSYSRIVCKSYYCEDTWIITLRQGNDKISIGIRESRTLLSQSFLSKYSAISWMWSLTYGKALFIKPTMDTLVKHGKQFHPSHCFGMII